MTGRRLIGALAVIAVAAGAALVAGSLSSSTPSAVAGSGSSGNGGSTQGSSATTAASARCGASSLAVWLGVGSGGAAAGSTYLPLEFTNASGHACTLYGYPGVSARSADQLGSAAGRNPSAPRRSVTIAAGGTAHAVLQLVDVGNFPPASCGRTTATDVRVYPPGSTRYADIPYRLAACSKAGPVYLSVSPVVPGVGVPGRP